MTYFAAALARTETGWTGRELDLDDFDDLESIAEELRELTGDGAGPALLLLEEDDEYVAVVRVDGGVGALQEPRVFLSDVRAVQASEVAAMLWEDATLVDQAEDDEAEEDGSRPVAQPGGDRELLSDFGYPGPALVDVCGAEGLLPADVISALCERIGCLEVLESLREG